jgi:hypothetical protein
MLLFIYLFLIFQIFCIFLVEIFDKTCCPKKENTEWVQKLLSPSDLQMCLFVAKIIALNIVCIWQNSYILLFVFTIVE